MLFLVCVDKFSALISSGSLCNVTTVYCLLFTYLPYLKSLSSSKFALYLSSQPVLLLMALMTGCSSTIFCSMYWGKSSSTKIRYCLFISSLLDNTMPISQMVKFNQNRSPTTFLVGPVSRSVCKLNSHSR